MSTPAGAINATAPTLFNPKRINLRGFTLELSKAAAKFLGGAGLLAASTAAHNPAGVAGAWNTIASGFPDLIAAFANNVGTLDEGDRAYLLVERALAAAMIELTGEVRGSFQPVELDEVIWLEDYELYLAPDFLERPHSIAILEPAAEELRKWLVLHGQDEFQARASAERLPNYFALKFYEEWTKHSEFFAPIQKRLSGPLAHVPREEWKWYRYRQELIQSLDRPLFEERFGLRKVFVPLNAHWLEKTREGEKKHEVILEAALRQWFTLAKQYDNLRVISGDPGSGKSSCARHWAASLAAEDPYLRVVLVQLHSESFAYKGVLRDSLQNYLKKEYEIDADILAKDYPNPVLLFFDGLDELAMAGKAAREAAKHFVGQVLRMLESANQNSQRVWVVLGGRKIVVQDCEGELNNPEQILHLEPYNATQRNRWWEKYGTASGHGYTALPQELKRPDLDTITAQPLLNYLVALSYDSTEERKEKQQCLDFSKPVSINQIYQHILARVYRRVWGDGKNIHLQGETSRLPQDKFEQILEEIGIAVWHGDSRTATMEAIRQRCEGVGLLGELKVLEGDTEAGLFRLLTAFHFRMVDKDKGSVEFTHKSFGEYLAARRIVRQIEDICDERERNRKRSTVGMTINAALVAWCKLCGPSALDATDLNLFELVKNEVKARDETTRAAWEQVLLEMFDEMIAQGMPMEKCELETYREMDVQSRNAEEALLGVLSTCLTPQTRLEKTDNRQAAPLVARLHFRNGLLLWNLASGCITTLNHLGYRFWNTNLTGADLAETDLTEADLTEAVLTGANLTRANLTGADLTRTDLTNTDLTETDLMGANLTEARFWQYAIGFNIRIIDYIYRPAGWQDFFREQGWEIEDTLGNEHHTELEASTDED